MLSLSVKTRKDVGKKLDNLRKKGIIPAVLYGPKVKSMAIEVDSKDFKKIYKEAGESSLFSVKIDDKEFLVLIHEIQRDSISGEPIHIDFYQPILTEEVEVTIPLVFEGEAPAIKELGGTLIKDIQEVQVKALPQNLPHEIKVNVEVLRTFEDEILIKDLKVSEGVKILKEPDEIVASVVPLEKVKEELEKPIEEKVEEVETIEKEKKEKEKEVKEMPEEPEKNKDEKKT